LRPHRWTKHRYTPLAGIAEGHDPQVKTVQQVFLAAEANQGSMEDGKTAACFVSMAQHRPGGALNIASTFARQEWYE